MGVSTEHEDATVHAIGSGSTTSESSPLLPSRTGKGDDVADVGTKKKRWWVILPVFALVTIYGGLTIASIPEAQLNFFGPRLMTIQGVFSVLSGVTSMVASPWLGQISDRVGRRKVLFWTRLISSAQIFPMSFTENQWWFMVLSPLAGLMEAWLAVGFAYVADNSTPENRTWVFGISAAFFYTSFVVSTIVCAAISKYITLQWVWHIMNITTVVMSLYIWFLIPDDTPEKPIPSSQSAESTGEVEAPNTDTVSKKPGFLQSLMILSADHTVLFIALAWCFFSIIKKGYELNVFVFLTQYLHFDAKDRALQTTLAGLFGGMAGLVMSPIARLIGQRNTVILGMVVRAGAIITTGLATSKILIMAVLPTHLLGDMVGPMGQTMLSLRVGQDMQGTVLGAVTGLNSMTTLFAPLVFGALCNWFADHATHHAGDAFVVMSVFIIPAVFLMVFVPRNVEPQKKYEEVVEGGVVAAEA